MANLVGPADVRRLVETVKYSDNFDNWDSVMDGDQSYLYVYEIAGQPAGNPLTLGDLIVGLTHLVHSGGWGLWLDLNESFLINERCQRLIETRVGMPDAAWDPNSNYVAFEHNPDDRIDVGLFGFDTWLQQEHERHSADMVSWGQSTDSLRNLRLVEISTNMDYVVSIIHPAAQIDELIARLGACGIEAWRQELWPEPAAPRGGLTREFLDTVRVEM